MFDSVQVEDMISYKCKTWIVFVDDQKSIGESDISTVKTISPSLNCTHLPNNQYSYLSKTINQDTFF